MTTQKLELRSPLINSIVSNVPKNSVNILDLRDIETRRKFEKIGTGLVNMQFKESDFNTIFKLDLPYNIFVKKGKRTFSEVNYILFRIANIKIEYLNFNPCFTVKVFNGTEHFLKNKIKS